MRLSKEELEILMDAEFLPLKAIVCQRVENNLLQLGNTYQSELQEWKSDNFPELLMGNYRISKGENYRSLAYRVLDYPSVLGKDDMFLFRTMMLWGDAFSWHLILAGKYLEAFGLNLIDGWESVPEGAFLSLHDNPWIWHQSDENWIEKGKLKPEMIREELRKRKFLKISHFLPLDQYSLLESRGLELLKSYLNILFDKLRKD
ncbi:MAG: hypothetical protein MRZ79_11720 [Bacteroidia bacterium]|nr:hypothetical protein [Bacteroidia bacterium]